LFSLFGLSFAAAIAPWHLPAAQTPAPGGPQIDLYVARQSLANTLETVGSLANMPMVVDPSVDKVIVNTRIAGRLDQTVRSLAEAHGLFYWNDGGRYVITAQGQLSRYSVNASRLDAARAELILEGIAPVISAGAIRFDQRTRVISITGTRELRDAIEAGVNGAAQENPSNVTIIRYGVSGPGARP
jgi:type II secretory pathway component GspD/PulD (secretin)